MFIGKRLREIREARNLSQGHIERRTGLIRCCVSRKENGHTVPAVETLEKFARALEVPLYTLFYEGESPKPRGGESPASGRAVGELEQFNYPRLARIGVMLSLRTSRKSAIVRIVAFSG